MNQLGKLFGVSHVAVLKWLKRGDWPFGRPPWDAGTVQKIRGWLKENLSQSKSESDAVGGDQMTKPTLAKLKLTLEKAESEKVRREILLKRYHLVEECDRRNVRKVHEVREALLNLAAALPLDAISQYSGEYVKRLVNERLVAICQRFAAAHGVAA